MWTKELTASKFGFLRCWSNEAVKHQFVLKWQETRPLFADLFLGWLAGLACCAKIVYKLRLPSDFWHAPSLPTFGYHLSFWAISQLKMHLTINLTAVLRAVIGSINYQKIQKFFSAPSYCNSFEEWERIFIEMKLFCGSSLNGIVFGSYGYI